jgi:hypothetical protein
MHERKNATGEPWPDFVETSTEGYDKQRMTKQKGNKKFPIQTIPYHTVILVNRMIPPI